MNKNTLLAFILVLITVAFFNSSQWNRFYYETILKKPYPAQQTKTTKTPAQNLKTERDTIKADTSVKPPLITEVDSIPAQQPQNIEADTVWIENEKMIAGITEEGARIVSLKMKDYNYSTGKQKGKTVDLVVEGSSGGAQLSIAGVSYNNKLFQFQGEKTEKIKVGKDQKKTLLFNHTEKNGDVVKKEFTFEGDKYQIGFRVGGSAISGERITVGWLSGINESETGDAQPEPRIVHFFDGSSVEHITMKKPGNEETTGNYKWVGITSKYFFINIVSDTIKDADISVKGFESGEIVKKQKPLNYAISYTNTADANTQGYWFFTGPNQLQILKSYNLKFEKVLFQGWKFLWANQWFPWLAEFVLWLLIVLYNLVKDFGVAILLITVLSRVVTFPMTQSSTKSMTRMKDIQPKVDAIRKKYKNNPQKMNEEIMAVYRQEGVNPLNPGCLPMFLQMPIFIALFVVLRKAIELRGAGTWLIPWVNDLSKPESLVSLESIIPGGIPLYGSSIALLPILMAVLTYFQNKMTIKDPNQKAMIYFMPVFMLVLFNNFPAGLVLYWTASSALAILQQYYTEKFSKKNVAEATAKKK